MDGERFRACCDETFSRQTPHYSLSLQSGQCGAAAFAISLKVLEILQTDSDSNQAVLDPRRGSLLRG